MRFLPIVDRELRVAARRWGTFWLRTWVAMTVIAVSTWIVLVNLNERPTDVAGILFYTISIGALLYCLLIGLSATTDSLSEEKREGTLGLLFLTDLKGFDIVAGKLAASSLNCIYGLLAIIPVMGLPLLMGGITALQYWTAALALVNAMFFSLAVGMFASACCHSRRKSVLLAFLIIMLLAVVAPGFALWQAQARSGLPFESVAFLVSPITAFFAPLDLGGLWAKSWKTFAAAFVTVHFESWIFLLLACLVAPRSWQDRPAGKLEVRWRERWRLWSLGDHGERHRFRARLLDVNAFGWLAARERLKPLMVWCTLGMAGALWLWGYGKYGREWLNEVVFVLTGLGLNLVLKCWVATEVIRRIAEERRTGSLELLLVTPLTPRDILRGQALALSRQFLGPVLVVAIVEAIIMLGGVRHGADEEERWMWFSWWATVLAGLGLDLIALYWLGLWQGLNSSGAKRAYLMTIGLVLFLPCLLYALFVMVAVLIASFGRTEMDWKFLLAVWAGLGLAADVTFGGWASFRLKRDFREAATRRFQKPKSWWERLLG